ncbi:MAG TPA: hypothetical protein PKK00_05410 [Bacteroidales bacterium]|nr:hypothetical protein [Bacteroidales bacterium]HPS17584.1 hypothetical protein [Bacteroidales bacterium]
MNRKLLYFIFIGFIFFITTFSACYYDVSDELYPNDAVAGCDTANVTYDAQIKTLLNSKCTSCHYTGGPDSPSLDNLTSAHEYAISTNGHLLFDEITNPNKTIPEHANLPAITDDCQKAQMKKWLETGAN